MFIVTLGQFSGLEQVIWHFCPTRLRKYIRFPGQYFDSEISLHYNYFRDYDPSIGRYIQSDPIGLDGGFSTYSYVNQNPIILIDFDGLIPGLPQILLSLGPDCGTGPTALIIPDRPFREACKKHDKCYDTCGKSKEICDLELCNNGACFYGFLLDSALSGPSKEAYDDAQKDACDGCEK